MFVEALKRQNPALISAALSLWQQGKIAPDSWVIDVDQILENGKRLIETARLYGIELYLMTKQFGRNPWLAEKLLALGYSGIVAVDYKEARVMRRAGLPVAHQGHLVQIPCHQVADAVEQGTDVITVFTLDKAREVSAAAVKAGRIQSVLLKVYSDDDFLYPGQESGFALKVLPETLQSLTIIEAQQKQFALVDSICRHFPGSEFLTGGDLGLTPGLNQPRVTQRVEQVLADAFHAQAAALVQGAGTGAIRAGLAALLKPGQRLLVHDAPVYPTTRVIIEQMGLTLITVDFNDLSALKQVVDEQQPDAALVQHTRQQPQDSYVLADVLATLRAAGVPALTDDNYAVMKVARIGCECGANVSTFSCFKLFGPEGVGAVVGDADVINRIRATLYSGGSQIQGAQALEVLRGLVFAPVIHAVQAGVSERLLALLNGGAVPEVKSAVIANAQSKVLIVEFHQPIAARVLEEAQKRGALPYPVGAESKYEIPPLFYRLSGTFRQANPQSEHCAIRINPNRSGEETVLRILRESIASI
ncbi:TPA: aminotransferase class I/II-fold pyridoxal phosphate-dependent enzyme [Escherichia coli]|nr:aminotransferase class I/II-fold pyridoxal phosphate-dependent enzyme [Escherichia coli]